MTCKFDIKQYDINFNSVFLKPEIEKEFFYFLEKEYNTEGFLCLKEISKFEVEEKIEQRIFQLENITKTYLLEESESEVNISGKTKKEFLTKISGQLKNHEKWTFEETAVELMLPIKRCLLANLHTDSFPRFIRLKDVETLYAQYQNDTSVMVPRSAIQFPYKNKKFEEKFIDDECFRFGEALAKDSYDWDILYSKMDCKIYQAKVNFLPFASFFDDSYAMKLETIIPMSIEILSCFFFTRSRYKIPDQGHFSLKIGEVLTTEDLNKLYPEQKMKHDRITASFEIQLQNVFPIDNRIISVVESIDINPDTNSIIYVHKSYIPDEFHGDESIDWKKHVKFQKSCNNKMTKGYMCPSFFYIHLQKIDDHTTKVNQIKIMNPRGKFANQHGIVQLAGKILGHVFAEKMAFKEMNDEIHEDIQKKKKKDEKCSDELKKDPLTGSLIDLIEKYGEGMNLKFNKEFGKVI
eukprot:gene6947-11109_t